jgi:hypothetical protein
VYSYALRVILLQHVIASKFINLLEERGILLPPLEDEEEDNTNQAIRNAASKSLDQRGKVVEETRYCGYRGDTDDV